MSKFGGFFSRKAGLYDRSAEVAAQASAMSNDNPLELDEELFSALGAQLGGDNESLRNLLLDANAKIGELDTIKNAVGKLVDPVSKALRAFETEKSEKISLQTVLNNTRTAYGKLRNEVAELEKKASFSEKECQALRQELTTTQHILRTLEATKAEIAIDIATRRAQIVDLEARLAQETGEGKALREENRRLDERLSNADKRVVSLESELNGARQRLLMIEDEKRSQQISLDKISAEAARVSRKLAETEASLTATHGRLRHVEGNFAELSTERARLANAIEEGNERHEHELTTQRMRFDALQARAAASEKLLGEAREHLLARADEIRVYDRRAGELAQERDALQTRVSELEAENPARIPVHGSGPGACNAHGTQRRPHPRLYRERCRAAACGRHDRGAKRTDCCDRSRSGCRKTGHRTAHRRPWRVTAPRADAVFRCGRRFGNSPQGFRSADARGHGPAA